MEYYQYSDSNRQVREGATVTLWILFCRMTKDVDMLFTFYACDRGNAERQARAILAEHPYERLDLKAYPGGFVIHHARTPGTIEDERR